MSHIHRIVVGMDLDEPGDVALRSALALAAPLRAVELHVAHVLSPRREANLAVLSRALEGAMATLRARVATVGASALTELDVRLHVRIGAVASTLEQIAIDYDGDLLVVGTHARTGAARFVLGSVAEALTKSARLPLLIAREKDFAGLARTPGLDPPRADAELRGDQHVTDLVRIGRRDSHIAGLV
jgi:nucleotide-binding universal stress UspA family protein